MKKSKLLFSVLTIASTSAIIVPMVTSCQTNTDNGISYQFITDGQELQAYTSQVTPKATGAVYKKAASTESWTTPATIGYINDVKSNPKIFADDVLQNINNQMTGAKYQNFTLTLTNILSSRTLRIYGEDVPFLSATIKIAIEHSEGDVKNDKETATITFNNLLPKLTFDAEGKNPKLALYGDASFIELSLTSSSINFAYNYTDKEGNVQSDFNLNAKTYVEKEALVTTIEKYKDSIDQSIQSAISLLNLDSAEANAETQYIALPYFVHQVEATA